MMEEHHQFLESKPHLVEKHHQFRERPHLVEEHHHFLETSLGVKKKDEKGVAFLVHVPEQSNSQYRGTAKDTVHHFSDMCCTHIMDDELIIRVDEMWVVVRQSNNTASGADSIMYGDLCMLTDGEMLELYKTLNHHHHQLPCRLVWTIML